MIVQNTFHKSSTPQQWNVWWPSYLLLWFSFVHWSPLTNICSIDQSHIAVEPCYQTMQKHCVLMQTATWFNCLHFLQDNCMWRAAQCMCNWWWSCWNIEQLCDTTVAYNTFASDLSVNQRKRALSRRYVLLTLSLVDGLVFSLQWLKAYIYSFLGRCQDFFKFFLPQTSCMFRCTLITPVEKAVVAVELSTQRYSAFTIRLDTPLPCFIRTFYRIFYDTST